MPALIPRTAPPAPANADYRLIEQVANAYTNGELPRWDSVNSVSVFCFRPDGTTYFSRGYRIQDNSLVVNFSDDTVPLAPQPSEQEDAQDRFLEAWLRQRREKELKEKEELERNPKWVIGYDGDKPEFNKSRYGFASKQDAVTSQIGDYNAAVKEDLKEINRSLQRVTTFRARLLNLKQLDKELKEGKQDAK